MEVGELSAKDDVVTKEGLSGQGKDDGSLTVVGKEDEEKAAKNKPRVTYTKEDLLNLRESPASKLWPSIFSEEHVRNGIWDPEAWHQSFSSEKRSASPGEELRKQLVIEDGIVLSPQRQSFGQGCQIPHSAPDRHLPQERGKGSLSRTTDRERDGRSRLTGRVGRGRALDYKERTPLQERNKDFDEPPGKYIGTRERDERTARDRGPVKDKERGFREKEKERKRSREEPSRGKNIQVRKKQAKNAYDEEPEWFTFGPSSQFETMELKGFDDVEDEKKDRERRKSASDEIKAILSVGKKGPLNGDINGSPHETSLSPSQSSETGKKKEEASTGVPSTGDSNRKVKPFDINDFFLSDTLLPFTGGVDQTGSKFSQFFGRPGSNYSSSRSGSAGFSSGGTNTPRTPSPGPNYLFTPITPSADDGIESHGLAAMLQKTQISVQPLLDEVMSSGKEKGKVMGSVRLEDIEADVKKDGKVSAKKEISDLEQNKENIGKGVEMTNKPEQMIAFNMLVEKMKSSGTLPEKPQPVISGLPTHLLPTPPSPKRKSPRNTPSPLRDLRRSPSPTELLKMMTMQAPLLDPRPPSPAQVVPQMNRPPSPLEMFHKFNSIVNSPQDLFSSPSRRRSSPPLAMQAQHRRSPPLGFGVVNMQQVPHHVTLLHQSRPRPSGMPYPANQQSARIPQERTITPRGPPEQRSHTAEHPKHVPSQPSSPYIMDRSFMPTSVMRKIQQDRMDQKTPKTEEKGQARDHLKERSSVAEEKTVINRSGIAATGATPKQPPTGQTSSQLRGQSRSEDSGEFIKGALFQQHRDERQNYAIKQDNLLSPRAMVLSEAQASSPVLQKPTAFKPLPGSPQLPFSSLNSGVHSEPASPLHSFNQSAGSPLRPAPALPNSAPCTPQRHPLVDRAGLLSPHQLVSKGLMARNDSGSKPHVGLFGRSVSLDSQAKVSRSSITKVVAANEGRPLTHSYEQQAHVTPDKMPGYEDAFHGKKGESLSRGHPITQHSANTIGGQRMDNSEVTAQQEGLHANNPRPRFPGGEARPTPVHHTQRPFHGSHGPRSGPPLPNGQLSPSGMPAMHGHPGRTPFNSPMAGMGIPPRSAMVPGMMPPHVHPAYLRMMSSGGAPIGVPSPGMSPVSMRMQMPHSPGRFPVMPGHHPAMMFGGRPSPGYPPVNPAAAAAMMGAHSPHIPPQSGLQQGRARRVASPVMNHPPQSHSPGGGGNILSRWFSEDVLQQAHPGQRSVTRDFARKVMSVEELERQQTAAIN